MAHNVEPMDIDSDFDNKENTYHHGNVLSRTPCTEKGYEELDVSELNMKLRYSITPASSPMSKSYTANCLDNRILECPENIVNSVDNANLTRSFNSTLTKNDSLSKSSKLQPLQLHTTDQSLDNNRNTSVLRPLDTTVTEDGNNITVTVTETNDIDENLSLPSSSSSALHTPEATTPTKEIPKHDGGSPIMRGLKSVLNMFRASQSPIPSAESEDNAAKHDISSPVDIVSNALSDITQVALASTPIAARKLKEPSSKRQSPLKESIVFNEDLEKELLWKDETTILFSEEKIPIHKLFFQQSKHITPINKENDAPVTASVSENNLNETVEFMDVSYNDSVLKNNIISEGTDALPNANIAESDSEFVDCETTFTQQSDDEQHTEIVKQKVTSLDVDTFENSVDKTPQELQVTATEEDKKIDVSVADEIPREIIQDKLEMSDNNGQKLVNTSVSIESQVIMPQVKTQVETKISNEDVIQSLDGTVLIQSDDEPLTSSTPLNITQDLKQHMPNEVTPVCDATVAGNENNPYSSSLMNNAIQSIQVTSSMDESKSADKTVSYESVDKPMSVCSFIMNTTQNVTQLAELNATAVFENRAVSASTFIMNATQNIELSLPLEKEHEQLNATNTTENEPAFSSKFIMNTTQNIENPLAASVITNEQINITKLGDEPLLSSTFGMSQTQDTETLSNAGSINDQLNVTKNIENQPALSSTSIMSETINAEIQTKTENELDTTLIKSVVDVVTQVIESEVNKPLDTTVTVISLDAPVCSSTFIMSATQNDEHLVTSKNEILDGTVKIDTKDISSSEFIKDVTQDIESQMQSKNITTTLDSTILVDAEHKLVSSSTFVKDMSQNAESTITKDITEGVESQAGVDDHVQNLNTNVVVEAIQQTVTTAVISDGTNGTEICTTSEDPDVILSDEKLMTSFVDFKDVTRQIIDPEIVNDCINALNITLNLELCDQETKPEESDLSEKPTPSDTLKMLNASVSIDAHDATPVLVQDNSKTEINNQIEFDYVRSPKDVELNLEPSKLSEEIVQQVVKQNVELNLGPSKPSEEFVEQVVKQNVDLNLEPSKPVILSEEFVDQVDKPIVSDELTLKEVVEQVDGSVYKPLNPDLLCSSADVGKVPIVIKKRQIHQIDISKTIVKDEEKCCGENVPANIPLPDEDDLEVESLKTVHESVISKTGNATALPDVINDLDSSKFQHANRIDGVAINTIDHDKKPVDIITVALANTEIDKDEITNENNVKEMHSDKSLEDNLLNDFEKEIHVKKLEEIKLPYENISQPRNNAELEMQVSKSDGYPESMDISFNARDTSIQKQNETTYSNITTSVQSDLTSFDLNIINTKEEEPGSLCRTVSQPKIESTVNSMPAIMLPDANVLQNMSVDDMEFDVPTNANVIVDKKEIIESAHSTPITESDMASNKEVIHEEIIVSENNSPYVLVSVDKEADKFDRSLDNDFEKIENPFDNKSKISPAPLASPPIASKGYNFNFDEIDDPFATKTKIRASPPLDSPNHTIRLEKTEVKKEVPKREPVNKNKRKSFPVRPKPVVSKNNFKNTFDGSLPSQTDTVKEKPKLVSNDNIDKTDMTNHNQALSFDIEDATISHSNVVEPELNVEEKSELENNIDDISKVIADVLETQKERTSFENKSPISSTAPSSSDQSVYLSAATSSVDSITTRNVFNLPEIDDINFNPFATKSKIRQSPTSSLQVDEPDISYTKTDTTVTLHENVTENNSVDKQADLPKNRSVNDEKDTSYASNTTCSSKDDKNTTVREVHTDSDDTIEGPFLEAEDKDIEGLGLPNKNKDNNFEELGLQNDMMQFSELPAQDNEDNELFIDAAAYEFLLNQNKSNVVVDSGKESLFLKFDPLFAKRLSSEGIAAALNKIQKRQSTPKKIAKPPQIPTSEQVIPGPSTSKVSPQELNCTEDITEDLNITTSKPMMVVTPAVNPIVTPRKATTPTSSNRRSITFTSPAIAVIDRLLSMSANNSFVEQNTTISQLSREQNEADMALVQLRELLAEKEINVYNLRSESKELKDRLTTLETQMLALETESEQRLTKVNELTEKLTEKTKINKSMAAVVEEYERTIASLIAETEQDRKRHAEERERLIKERDEQTAHLASMEVSFSDLHSKYEKSKQIILSCKANEDTYKKSIKEFEENLTKMQNNYELLKQHATSKLNHANQELEKMNRAHESEVLKLNAMIKRKELHITSLEETLAQKTKANEELTAICDELINKVG